MGVLVARSADTRELPSIFRMRICERMELGPHQKEKQKKEGVHHPCLDWYKGILVLGKPLRSD